MVADHTFSFTIAPGCGDTFTRIYDIQGTGETSPLAGQTVTTEGVVVGDFQVGGRAGYYIQDPTGDNNTATSDGIFIYNTATDVNVGDHVRVRGTAGEFNGLTQISLVSQVWVCSTGETITPTEVTLPVEAVSDFEKYEGMLVTFPQSLVISEYFNFDRYGEIVLTSQRHMTPTAFVEPGADAQAAAQAYLLDRITLDDGRTAQNPDPAIHPNGQVFNMDNLFRGGDKLANVTGVIDYSFNLYRIQPTEGADYISAKEDQGFLEGRILEVETILANAEVIDEPGVMTGKVQIGNKVTVQEAGEPEEVFELVGVSEVNTLQGKISYESPIGSALLDKRVGDKVTVKTLSLIHI